MQNLLPHDILPARFLDIFRPGGQLKESCRRRPNFQKYLRLTLTRLLRSLKPDESLPTKADEKAIVQKYEEGQPQILIQRNDFLVPNILQMVESKDVLSLTPPYQRRLRWTAKKRAQLIESLLRNIPIPPIFLYEHELAKYEVMDGQQRLDTIRAFFNNEFALEGLEKWSELDGSKFEDLPVVIQRALSRRGLAAVIILTESGHNKKVALQIRQDVFERLNTGGEKLNPQEVRNCIYASNFNKILIQIARSDAFTRTWGIPPKEPGEPAKISDRLRRNPLYAKMDDCQIVLRYFALADMSQFTGGMKQALDDCMERMTAASISECARLKDEYENCLRIAIAIFGESTFRLPNNAGKLTGRRSVPLADAVLLAIRSCGADAKSLPKRSGFLTVAPSNSAK